MCGITGIKHFDTARTVNQQQLEKMTHVLSHRGPDGSGFFIDGSIGFGHRRLSIIDLNTGDQPMFNEDRSLGIIHNGEVFNYLEIKEELRHLGYQFHTVSDTEVILKAYQEWGPECLHKLNGMWAFAIWDVRQQKLFLSRDRLGVKPLYYAQYDNSLLFGSEPKSLLAYGMPDHADESLLEIYLHLGYIPSPYCYFKGMHKLEPGHYLEVAAGKIKKTCYWQLPQLDEQHMIKDRAYVQEKFRSLLQDAVKLRMRSDVPFGTFLSGGLDSSTVVYLMSLISDQQATTFTMGFENPLWDERDLANIVATQFKTLHHEQVVEEEQFERALTQVSKFFDEPFGDSSAIATGHISKYASEQVKMVLTGDGGDETQSGYTYYQGEKLAQQLDWIPKPLRMLAPPMIRAIASPLRGRVRYRLNRYKNILYSVNQNFNNRLIAKKSWIEPNKIKEMTMELNGVMPIEDYFHDLYQKCSYQDPFYKIMFFDLMVNLPDDMLTKVDRMSMAHSIETRMPFVDYRLVEFLAKVDKDLKMDGYERKTILRGSFGKNLPQQLLSASKKGFGVPLREWFKGKEFNHHMKNLEHADLGIKQKKVKAVIDRNVKSKSDYGNFLWMLFVLKLFKEKHH